MENMTITSTRNNTFVVKADTTRFGRQAIMFESYNFTQCVEWIEQHGGAYTLEALVQQMAPVNIQIKSNMLHSVVDYASFLEQCHKAGLCMNRAEEVWNNTRMVAPLVGKLNSQWEWGRGAKKITVKLGHACTW